MDVLFDTCECPTASGRPSFFELSRPSRAAVGSSRADTGAPPDESLPNPPCRVRPLLLDELGMSWTSDNPFGAISKMSPLSRAESPFAPASTHSDRGQGHCRRTGAPAAPTPMRRVIRIGLG